MKRLVIGISGASGIILAKRLMEAIPWEMDVVITPQALYTARYELNAQITTAKRFISLLEPAVQQKITLHSIQDIGSSIASGSYLTMGMVIIPCSMATLAAIRIGLADNCLRRAADVTLKEKRPLILVPREAPLSAIHLENMLKLAQMGATIIPPMPTWYHKPNTIEDVEKGIVGKILESFNLPHTFYPQWRGES